MLLYHTYWLKTIFQQKWCDANVFYTTEPWKTMISSWPGCSKTPIQPEKKISWIKWWWSDYVKVILQREIKADTFLTISILIRKFLKNSGNQWKLSVFVKFKSLSEKESWHYFKSQIESQYMYMTENDWEEKIKDLTR